MGDEYVVTPSQMKSWLVGSRLLAISIWHDDETKALADSFGAVTLLDKMNLACPSPKSCPGRAWRHSPSRALEDETRIEPGVFADAMRLSAGNL